MADLVQGRTYRLQVQDCCIEDVTFVGVLAEVERDEDGDSATYVFRNGPCELKLDSWQVPSDVAEVSAKEEVTP